MPDWLPTVLATIAGILSTSSFVPQVVKARRERDTRAISKHRRRPRRARAAAVPA